MAPLFFILICLIWGTSFILMREAALAFGPLGIAGWRLVSGAAALAALWTLTRPRDRRRGPLRREHLAPMALVGLLGYALPFYVQPYVIHRYQASALMGMIISLGPLLTMIVSVPMLRVYPTRRQVAGILLGVAFAAVLFGGAWGTQITLAGLVLAASVPMSYAVANTFVKRRFNDVPALPLSCAALAMTGAWVLPLGLVAERVDTGAPFPRAALALAVLGVLCTGLATFMFYRLIQLRGPLYASVTAYVIPQVAIFWGWLAREPITAQQLVGLAGVLASVAIVQWPARRGTARGEPPATQAVAPPD